jgi:hypothetical protein
MLYSKRYIQSLYLVRKTLITVSLCVFAGQIILDASSENIVSNLLAVTAFIAGSMVVFNYRNISVGAALSATVVFLMISANSLAPMIGTLLEGHPIVETLTVPVEVFTHRLIFAVCLLFAHYLSCSSSSMRIRLAISRLSKSLKTRLTIPTQSLWVIGAIGLISIILKFIHLPEFITKFFDGFGYLMLAPFLMLLPPYYTKALMRKERVRLILFYLLQVVFSFVFNSRMAMVLPAGIIIAGWLLTLLTGQSIVNKRLIRTGILRGIIGLALVGQFADLSTAILIARENRETRSGIEQMKATFNVFLDKQALADYKVESLELLKGISATQDWQENYVRNPFLARFIQVKFDDNCFYRITSFSQSERDVLRKITLDKIVAQLPQPVLNLFSINIDKKYVSSFSIGDEIDALSTGADGGFKTGSIPSHVFALFSWWYPIALVTLYYLIFSIYHGFFTPFVIRLREKVQIPTLALLLTFTIYVEISLDGVDVLAGALLRGIIQMVLIYAIALWIVKKLKFPVNTISKQATEKKCLN